MRSRRSLAISMAGLLSLGAALLGAAQDAAPDGTTSPRPAPSVSSVLDFSVRNIQGEEVALSRYKGQVLLIVNVASRCGLTPQYEQLQTLYTNHREQGLRVLAFPSNDFGSQEPGSNSQIQEFCRDRFGVTFDLFSKVTVKGDEACDLYRYLTSQERNGKFGGEIRWNFTKFLVDRSGKVIARFESRVRPDAPEVLAAIEKALAEKPAVEKP